MVVSGVVESDGGHCGYSHSSYICIPAMGIMVGRVIQSYGLAAPAEILEHGQDQMSVIDGASARVISE